MKKGFTLIELLVVIAIIALLLSILMPSLQKVKEKTKEVICRNNVRQLAFGMIQYANDNDGKAVPMVDLPGEYWFHQIAKYLGDDYYKDNPDVGGGMDVAFCPSTKRRDQNPAPTDVWFGSAEYSWRFLGGEGSYGMNLWLQSDQSGSWGKAEPLVNYPKNWFEKMGTASSSVPVFADSVWVGSWPFEQYSPLTYFDGIGYPGFPHDVAEFMARFLMDRHGMAINVSYIDGSTEKIPLEDMWSAKWHRNFSRRGTVDLSQLIP